MHFFQRELLIGWCIAAVTGLLLICGIRGYYGFHTVTLGGKTESLLYIGLCRFAWSVVVAWVIFVCAQGYGGKFLHRITGANLCTGLKG